MAAVFLVAGFQDANKTKKNRNTSNATTLGYGALASFNNAATGTVALEMETGERSWKDSFLELECGATTYHDSIWKSSILACI